MNPQIPLPSLFVWLDSLCPINNLSVKQGLIFLGWTSTKLRGFINFFGIKASRQSRRVIWQYLPINSIQIYQK